MDVNGEWLTASLDLDNDGLFTGVGESSDARDYDIDSKLESIDTDGDQQGDVLPVYDEVGRLLNDGEAYSFVYDAFGRIQSISSVPTGQLLAEMHHNGLGYKIAERRDDNLDGAVNGQDSWHDYIYDPAWNQIAVYREGDTLPAMEFVASRSGLDSLGDATAVGQMLFRDRDEDGDGVLEERVYSLPGRRGDVSRLD